MVRTLPDFGDADAATELIGRAQALEETGHIPDCGLSTAEVIAETGDLEDGDACDVTIVRFFAPGKIGPAVSMMTGPTGAVIAQDADGSCWVAMGGVMALECDGPHETLEHARLAWRELMAAEAEGM